MRSAQTSLFENDAYTLTISEVAEAMNVSTASVRNWVKTGYLQADAKNRIDHASLEVFREKVIGSDKLTSRANKSRYDDHDHGRLVNEIEQLVAISDHNGDSLSSLYETSLSQSYRNTEGVFYTPPEICDLFFSHLPKNRADLTFLDPCCGTGNFLLAAIRAGIKPENVYGCDVDETALAIARKRIHELTGTSTNALTCADFLQNPRAVLNRMSHADVIFTNPPWGKKLTTSEREQLAKRFSCNKSLDTSGVFLLACRSIIRDGGFYGMLMPEAFFNVATFEMARIKMLEDNVLCVSDHGKAFEGLLTRAVSFIAIKERSERDSTVVCMTSRGIDRRAQSSFLRNPSMILNYWADSEDAALLDFVSSLPHITLAGQARWALGVVTGNNKRHLSEIPMAGFVPVYRGSDINSDSLKPPSSFISKDMSAFQQVAPIEMYEAPEKLLYRFISSKLIFYHDTSQALILNSANLLIPHHTFPIDAPRPAAGQRASPFF